MSKKGKKNLSGGMAGLSLEDGSEGSDEELEQVEVRMINDHHYNISAGADYTKILTLFRSKKVPLLL